MWFWLQLMKLQYIFTFNYSFVFSCVFYCIGYIFDTCLFQRITCDENFIYSTPVTCHLISRFFNICKLQFTTYVHAKPNWWNLTDLESVDYGTFSTPLPSLPCLESSGTYIAFLKTFNEPLQFPDAESFEGAVMKRTTYVNF